MPGRDGTGPMGQGPRYGRGFGPCAGYPVNPYYGCGMGYGRSRGFRRMLYGFPVAPAAYGSEQEKTLLEDQAKFLENQLEQVRNQLKKHE